MRADPLPGWHAGAHSEGGDRSRTRRGHDPREDASMSTATPTRRVQEIALEAIETGSNVRDLDAEHVAALARSMALRGLIVPINVHPLDGARYALDAGEPRLAAARELGWATIAATITEQAEGASGDQGAENVLRKTRPRWRRPRPSRSCWPTATPSTGR